MRRRQQQQQPPHVVNNRNARREHDHRERQRRVQNRRKRAVPGILRSETNNNTTPSDSLRYCVKFRKLRPETGGLVVFRQELPFGRVFWETLRSLAKSDKSCKNINMNPRALRTTTVTQPRLWRAIWRQFSVDAPRQTVIFNNQVYRDAHQLFFALGQHVGPLSSRWLVAFLNQAPLADMLQAITDDVNARFRVNGQCGQLYVGEEQHPRGFGPIMCVSHHAGHLSITYHKTFRVFRLANERDGDAETVRRVHAIYRLRFRPRGHAQVKWWYEDAK